MSNETDDCKWLADIWCGVDFGFDDPAIIFRKRWLRNAQFYIGTQDLEWRASLFGRVAPRWLRRIVPARWLGKWEKSANEAKDHQTS